MSHVDLPILDMTFSKVTRDTDNGGDDRIVFETEAGVRYIMMHHQDCCESVKIEDIDGDLQDLVGNPITRAEEASNGEDAEYAHSTWTFYRFATIRGDVHIRWYGVSNGYYSEAVSFYKEE
jgi:hypothetical protein